jgi:hypothetical protein
MGKRGVEDSRSEADMRKEERWGGSALYIYDYVDAKGAVCVMVTREAGKEATTGSVRTSARQRAEFG